MKEALINSLVFPYRHSGGRRNPGKSIAYWIPAFAGMTKNEMNQGFLNHMNRSAERNRA